MRGVAPLRRLCGCRLLECRQQPSLHRQEAETSCVESGTYVITGGLGSLGLLVTHWLYHKSSSSFKVHDRQPMSPCYFQTAIKLPLASVMQRMGAGCQHRPAGPVWQGLCCREGCSRIPGGEQPAAHHAVRLQHGCRGCCCMRLQPGEPSLQFISITPGFVPCHVDLVSQRCRKPFRSADVHTGDQSAMEWFHPCWWSAG